MIQQLQKTSPNTYNKFVLWMIKEIYKGDSKKYSNFTNTNWQYQIISFIYFLEKQYNVPMVNALDFYKIHRPQPSLLEQLKILIIYEFIHIEQGKKNTYEPF